MTASVAAAAVAKHLLITCRYFVSLSGLRLSLTTRTSGIELPSHSQDDLKASTAQYAHGSGCSLRSAQQRFIQHPLPELPNPTYSPLEAIPFAFVIELLPRK